ncbi:unnamed protein product, partial [Urochloa humidicola]
SSAQLKDQCRMLPTEKLKVTVDRFVNEGYI